MRTKISIQASNACTRFATTAIFFGLVSGCLPDNLKKWDEPEQKVQAQTGVNVTGPGGTTLNVPAPSGGTAPSSISYGATSFGYPIGKAITELKPTITGQTGTSNDYVYTLYDSTGITTAVTLPPGLSLNTSTGSITGTPTSFVTPGTSSTYLVKVYHVQSGSTVTSPTFEIKVATDFTAAGFNVFYPQVTGQKLVLKLGATTNFNFNCTPDCYVSNQVGAKGKVEYVNHTTKEIFVEYDADASPSTKIFSAGDNVDNRDTFISTETTITQVIYSIDVGTSAVYPNALPIRPHFTAASLNSGTSTDAERASYIEWSVNPNPPGGLFTDPDDRTMNDLAFMPEFDPDDVINDSSLDLGGFNALSPHNALTTSTFNVIVGNVINQTKSISLTVNLSNAPEQLSYSQQVLLEVDNNARFKIGSAISSSTGAKGTVIRKAGSTLLGVKTYQGIFKADDSVDDNSVYNTERAIVSSAKIYNAIFKSDALLTESAAAWQVDDCIQTAVDPASYARAIVVHVDRTNPISFTMTTPAHRELLAPGYLISAIGTTNQAYIDFIDDGGRVYALMTSGTTFANNSSFIIGTDVTTITNGLDTIANGSQDEIMTDVYVRFANPEDGINFQLAGASLDLQRTASVNNCDQASFASTAEDVTHIIAPNILLAPDAAQAAVKKGQYFSTADTTPIQTGSSGLVIAVESTSSFLMSVLNGIFDIGTRIDNKNPFSNSLGVVTVASVTPVSDYIAYRGEAFAITPQLSKGENIVYYLDNTSDPLPAGVTLNPNTGIIGGTPTEPAATRNLVIIATNSIGNKTAEISLKILDRFAPLNMTAGATSFQLHRTGKGHMNVGCQINSDQLNSSDNTLKDINCIMEAGELDLYFAGFKLGADVGKGLCEYVSLTPFSFYKFPYNPSGRNSANGYKVIELFDVDASCAGPGQNCQYVDILGNTVTKPCDDLISNVPNKCDSNYTAVDPTFPNCDDGYFRNVTYKIKAEAGGNPLICGDDPAELDPTSLGAITSCGGKRGNCIAGPVTNLITSVDDLSNGINSKIYSAFDGFINQSPTGWTFSSPISKGFGTNKSLANFTQDSQCHYPTAAADRYVYDSANWSNFSIYGLHKVFVNDITVCGLGRAVATVTPSVDYTGGVVYATESDPVTGGTATGGWVFIYNPGASLSGLNHGDTLECGPGAGADTTIISTIDGAINIDRVPHYSYDASPFLSARPFYTLSCLDAGNDLVARVRIMVRDWNRSFSAGLATDHIDTRLAQFDSFRFYADIDQNDTFGVSYDERSDWDGSQRTSTLHKFYTDTDLGITTCTTNTAIAAGNTPYAGRIEGFSDFGTTGFIYLTPTVASDPSVVVNGTDVDCGATDANINKAPFGPVLSTDKLSGCFENKFRRIRNTVDYAFPQDGQ